MKNYRTIQKQRGFFDLGIGLALTVLFGGTAVVIDKAHTDNNNVAKQQTEIVKITDEKLALSQKEAN